MSLAVWHARAGGALADALRRTEPAGCVIGILCRHYNGMPGATILPGNEYATPEADNGGIELIILRHFTIYRT